MSDFELTQLEGGEPNITRININLKIT